MSNAPSLALYANNRNMAQNLRDVFPWHVISISVYTKRCTGVHYSSTIKRLLKTILRAIEVNAEVIGSIGVFGKDDIYRKTAEIGY